MEIVVSLLVILFWVFFGAYMYKRTKACHCKDLELWGFHNKDCRLYTDQW